MSRTITTLQVTGKTSDLCNVRAFGPDGEFIGEHDGYVPKFFPEEHYGDYLELQIDVQTGMIKNWPEVLKTDAGQAIIRRDLKLPEEE